MDKGKAEWIYLDYKGDDFQEIAALKKTTYDQ